MRLSWSMSRYTSKRRRSLHLDDATKLFYHEYRFFLLLIFTFAIESIKIDRDRRNFIFLLDLLSIFYDNLCCDSSVMTLISLNCINYSLPKL